jgi:hypothetical protein
MHLGAATKYVARLVVLRSAKERPFAKRKATLVLAQRLSENGSAQERADHDKVRAPRQGMDAKSGATASAQK